MHFRHLSCLLFWAAFVYVEVLTAIVFHQLMRGTMDKKAQHPKNQPVANGAIATSKDFNFDLWANAVRKQMLSVLQEKTQH
jgi:hypothetical protein